MYCTKQITDQLVWVGGNDRRLAMFEGVYSVPNGVSYNAYLLKGDQTVLFDTVDKAVEKVFFENLKHELGGKALDYVVVHHVEPDHSATLELLVKTYPQVKVICNSKIATMLKQYFDVEFNFQLVNEGDTLTVGGHELTFVNAPMVHWPEVMMTYDKTSKTLFSADAFGSFGALNGAIFADEVDFERDYLDEARRYYTNIVGKYGPQVQAVLKKASALDIEYVCPLHGFVWRKNFGFFLEKYLLWSSYTPEEQGVLIAYASVYGNTENTAEILSSKLREKGIKTVMFDVSVTPPSDVISECFKYSHLVFASTTYNAGIFVQMESFLTDLVAHNIQNRTIALIENGSWAPTSGKQMREMLAKCKNLTILDEGVSIRSSLKENQLESVEILANKLAESLPKKAMVEYGEFDNATLRKLSYGLFVLSAKDGEKDNACIINTAIQVADNPKILTIAVNKQNFTHDMIIKTGIFNVSVLTEEAPFRVFERWGFNSGKDKDKFEGCSCPIRAKNGVYYVSKFTNAFFSGKVLSTVNLGSHTLFVAEITEAKVLSDAPSATYAYYHANIKPKTQPVAQAKGKMWVCNICGYIYDEQSEGTPFEQLPDDWTCPLCKHPKSDFTPQ